MTCQAYVIQSLCKAGEEGTFGAQVSFFDEEDAAVIPNNITWSLYDEDNNIVNSRSSVAVAVPAAVITIVLKADDLAIPDNSKLERRVLIVYDYDSTLGTALPVKLEYVFNVENLENVT